MIYCLDFKESKQAAASSVIPQLELWKEKGSSKYEKKVYVLPKHLDEKVASLHLGKLGARLTKLNQFQAGYISVQWKGPTSPHTTTTKLDTP
ncbi:hypothetical protein E2562_030520 [Oryza meyeriana var. granulata]|uniref:Adenosylhomocysteinase n=1 Tax=Oryza meyeriana var. granulata TaxID=110450 RepID=A0A6G1BPE2_9ORYZ|nr:hypothetical protein E2562_030520 [Oryza meyeriana var. granulata]